MSGKYFVPSMNEINCIPWNGYNVVSTFSGGGGSCLGYKMAGYRVVWANEFIPAAQDTYRANFASTFLNTKDIRDVTPEEICLQSGIDIGEIDIFDGSPPCAGFSMAGKREASWNIEKKYSDTKQRVDDLFFEYIRLLDGLKPRCFIAENVDGLVSGKAVGYFKRILGAMKGCGYKVSARVCDAAYLGVPQHRRRLIFVGVRDDLADKYGVAPVHPKPINNFITFEEATKGVVNDDEELKMLFDGQKYASYKLAAMLPLDPPVVIYGDSVKENSYFNLCRLSMHKPSATIMQSSGRLSSASGPFHPLYNRKLTIAEYKRLTSLPDDFILTGGYEKQVERIGRMVPPIMMKEISLCVKEHILDVVCG